MATSISPRNIKVDYLSRVEGETELIVKVGATGIEDIRLKIFEPPRFFEGFLVGRRFDEVGDIVSRICGICPISHMTTALQAVEDAMGVEISPQTRLLRRLMCVAQIVASHIVHLYVFVLPDYFGFPGFVPMMPKFKEETASFLQMKEAMNRVGALIGGRALHPVSMVVGGFTKLPSRQDLDSLAAEIEKVLPLALRTFDLLSGLAYPDFACRTEYMALRKYGEYAVNDGSLVSSRGLELDIHQYSSHFHEKQVPHAMAKKSFTSQGSPFMVGALARLNVKFDQYHDETKELLCGSKLPLPDENPFHNNIAQALEIYDGMLECLRLLSVIHPEKERPSQRVREGEGVAVTEAPRGLLMHSYRINRKGFVEKANLVTPTSHNFAVMEEDLRALVNRYSADEEEVLKMKCEKLIRAYDPCFSCSVH